MAKYDDMSFSKAFAKAREDKGKGQTFTWRGKTYTTNYKEEEAAKERKTTPAESPRPRARPAAGSEITVTVLPKTYQQATSELGARRSRSAASERTSRTIERARSALDRAAAEREADTKKRGIGATRSVTDDSGKSVTYNQWKEMSRAERARRGLPVSTWGGAIRAWRKAGGLGRMSGETEMAKGGMAKKK